MGTDLQTRICAGAKSAIDRLTVHKHIESWGMEMLLQEVKNHSLRNPEQRESFWNLDSFKEKMLALKFARSIDNIFSVYIDDPINQVYTSYFLEVQTQGDVSILLSTDPYSDSIYDGVSGECLKNSRFWVFPGGFFNKNKYKFVLARMSGKSQARPEKLILPSLILEGLFPNYIPIITSKGLCEFQQTTPCLNLQFVDVEKLRDIGILSPMKLNELLHSVSEKINYIKEMGC